MGVFDWWETMQEFVFQNVDVPDYEYSSPHHESMPVGKLRQEQQGTFEVKLNVTDSELVVVENTAQWDTNAVILKVKRWSKYSDATASLHITQMLECADSQIWRLAKREC